MSEKWHQCGFCVEPIVKGEHTVGIPTKISPEHLKIWKSAAGLREHQDFPKKSRFHIDHFELKYRSVTSAVQPRVMIGAIPTLNVFRELAVVKEEYEEEELLVEGKNMHTIHKVYYVKFK